MTWTFVSIAVVTIVAAVAVMTLRNLIHCALAAAVAFVGLAALYLNLNAQFVGFAQILVYVGAVAILIVFAVLLTRGGEPANGRDFSNSWLAGLLTAVGVFAVLAWAITRSALNTNEIPAAPVVVVNQIGVSLMTNYVLPLEVTGLLLTAALIGAVIIAMRDESPKAKIEDGESRMAKDGNPSSILHPPSSPGGHS